MKGVQKRDSAKSGDAIGVTQMSHMTDKTHTVMMNETTDPHESQGINCSFL